MNKPLFLFTFANDKPGALLRAIAREQDAVRDVLELRKEDCELKFISSLTSKELIDRLCERRPAILHYGGHAEGDVLFFNSKDEETIQADELSSFLSHFDGVELVFLNGCSTFSFGRKLLDAGVRHAIVTHEKIGDEAAVEFARYFYTQIRDGKTVPASFEIAQDAARARFSEKDTRGIGIPALWKGTAPADSRYPWRLFNSERADRLAPWSWREPEEDAFGTVVSLKRGGNGLEGVEIRKGAQFKTKSDDEGNFGLKLKYSWVGKKISIEAKKTSFEVVNRDALTLFPEKNRDPDEKLVEIVMCPEGKRDIYAPEYYSIVIHDVVAKGHGSPAEKKTIIGHLPNIADQIQNLDVNDSLDQTLRALHFLGKGQINAAVDALGEEDLEEELKALKKSEQDILAKKKNLLDAFLLKASALLLDGRFDSAEEYFKKAMDLAPDDLSVLNKYLDYLYKQNKFSEGKSICGEQLQRLIDNTAASELARSNFLHQQGRFYWKSNDYESARLCFNHALALRRTLFEANTLPDRKSLSGLVAATQNNLGLLYLDEQDFETAVTFLLESLRIDSELAEDNPAGYIRYKATNLCDLGLTYTYAKDYEKAGQYYEEALRIYRALAVENPFKYEPKLARALLYQGSLLTDRKEFVRAAEVLLEALGIHIHFNRTNPEAYRPVLSENYHKLGKLYRESGDTLLSLDHYLESLKIREELCREAPESYVDEYAATLNNIGRIYSKLGKQEEAENCFKKSMEIDDVLMRINERVYSPYKLHNLRDLGLLYAAAGRAEDARNCMRKALELIKTLPPSGKPGLPSGLDQLQKELDAMG